VKDIPGNEKGITCYAEGTQLAPHPSTSWEVLRKRQHTWMWKNLQWVGDDDWIINDITKGTCMAVTNGLYMKDLYPHIHSTAVVLECTKGRVGYGAHSRRHLKWHAAIAVNLLG
jgi:hypothetical protein